MPADGSRGGASSAGPVCHGPGLYRAFPIRASLLVQGLRELVQQPACALLAAGRALEAIEKGGLFGEGQEGSGAVGPDLNRLQRGRDRRAVDVHPEGEDEALIGDDIEIERIVGVPRAVMRDAGGMLAPADAEVELERIAGTLVGPVEPGGLGFRVAPGG